MKNTLIAFLAVILVVTVGCGGSPSASPSESGAPAPAASVLTTIVVNPSDASLLVGGKQTFTATAKDQHNKVMKGVSFVWASTNAAVAQVSDGAVQAVGQGTANVTASASGVQGQAALKVTPPVSTPPPAKPKLTSILVSPKSASILVGGQQVLAAFPLDQNGQDMSGVTISWSSNNATIATVKNGMVSGTGPGTASIMASSGAVQGAANLTVNSIAPAAPVVSKIVVTPSTANVSLGTGKLFAAQAFDQYGNVMLNENSGVPVAFSWTSDNSGVAAVDSSGNVTSESEGTANIIATADGVNGSAALTVGAIDCSANNPDGTPSAGLGGEYILDNGFIVEAGGGAPVGAGYPMQALDSTFLAASLFNANGGNLVWVGDFTTVTAKQAGWPFPSFVMSNGLSVGLAPPAPGSLTCSIMADGTVLQQWSGTYNYNGWQTGTYTENQWQPNIAAPWTGTAGALTNSDGDAIDSPGTMAFAILNENNITFNDAAIVGIDWNVEQIQNFFRFVSPSDGGVSFYGFVNVNTGQMLLTNSASASFGSLGSVSQ
jgi:hypothetical protein